MSEPVKLEPDLEIMPFNEVQLLLAEKRTSLSTLRTGIAVFVLPLSVLSILIATSKSYELHKVMLWLVPLMLLNLGLVPLMLLNLGLVALGVYLVTRAVLKIR